MVTEDCYNHPFLLRTLPCKQLGYRCQNTNTENIRYLGGMKRRGTLKHILQQIEAVSQGRLKRGKKEPIPFVKGKLEEKEKIYTYTGKENGTVMATQ